jgi:hypothetical protein
LTPWSERKGLGVALDGAALDVAALDGAALDGAADNAWGYEFYSYYMRTLVLLFNSPNKPTKQ